MHQGQPSSQFISVTMLHVWLLTLSSAGRKGSSAFLIVQSPKHPNHEPAALHSWKAFLLPFCMITTYFSFSPLPESASQL